MLRIEPLLSLLEVPNELSRRSQGNLSEGKHYLPLG